MISIHKRYPYATLLLLLLLLTGVAILPAPGIDFFGFISSVRAATTFNVNSTGDGADVAIGDGVCDDGTTACTLRAAIQEANAISGDDTITFGTALNGSVITLNNALPNISGNLNIGAPGPNLITIRRSNAPGTPNFRLITVNSGITVSISGLALTNGLSTLEGGCIHNSGSLTLTNVVVTANRTANGLTASSGGGIYNNFSANLSLSNSTVSSNRTGDSTSGGAGGYGGGIQNLGTLTISSSTISSNQTGVGIMVGGYGGGIFNGGTLSLTNSTISGNQTGNAGNSQGGGIQNARTLNLFSCTVTNNSALGPFAFGGGLNTTSPDAPITLHNTIVAGNFRINGSTASDIGNLGTVVSSSSFNLIGTGGSGGLTDGVNNNQVGVADPKLGPLTDNGGLTMTHPLLSGSLAIDAGSNAIATSALLTTDQRGFARFIDGPDADTTATVDIGAYEAQVPFAEIGDTSVNEDTPAIIAFDVGDPSSITSITATSNNATLVPNDPANIITRLSSSTGSVTILPALNLFGTAEITVTVNRTGGSSLRTFQLTVHSSNDAPSFVKGADQTMNEDSGSQTVNNWATAMSAGPPDESGQSLSFIVTNNNNALFSSQPAISSNGTLTYTPAPDAAGSVTVSVRLKDEGGTANSGEDTSAAQTFTITLTQVNDAPSFVKGPDQTVNNSDGLQFVNNWATNISVGPSNETGSQGASFVITGNTNPGLFLQTPTISPNGRLVYRPSSSAGGTATITVVLQDNGGTANGGVDTSAPQTFNITVVPVGGFLKFSSSSINTTEGSGLITVTVERSGDLSRAVAVNYATSADSGIPCSTINDIASPKCDFTSALGTLSFAAGENLKTFVVLISQDSYVEGPETLTLSLSSPTNNATLTSPLTTTLTIADDVTEPVTNVIDEVSNFVRQHYHDFLNREGDQSGIDFWIGNFTQCGGDSQCLEVHHVNVSAAFFLSTEFQQTGYLVERIYKTAYGDAMGTSTLNGTHQISVPIVRFNEFLTDTQEIGRGVVIGQTGWEQTLENNKQLFVPGFVQRSRFSSAFPITMSPAQFVDKLFQNAGITPSATDRSTAINEFGGASNTANVTARSRALRDVAENDALNQQEFNRAFVLMQYFGYLRRNPNDPQDSDYTGYDFWLTKLNEFKGNFANADMVKAFLSATEYRQRFGP